jgi:hypothetical protein
LVDLLRFSGVHEDRCVPFFYGNAANIERVQRESNQFAWLHFRQQPLAAEQAATFVCWLAAAESGIEISANAKLKLLERIADVPQSVASLTDIWRQIKQNQTERFDRMLPRCLKHNLEDLMETTKFAFRVREIDVLKLPLPQGADDPVAELEAMIGLEQVKARVRTLAGTLALEKRQRELGIATSGVGRMNLLFIGNPGTGKTVVAKLLRRVLVKIKYCRPDKFALVDSNNVRTADEAAQIWRDNKDGIIFVDEFHQFDTSDERKRVLAGMVAPLAMSEYAGTVFIAAGYTRRTELLLKSADDGLESRFPPDNRYNFTDYSREDLARISRGCWYGVCRRYALVAVGHAMSRECLQVWDAGIY